MEHAIIQFDGNGSRIGSITSTDDVIVQAPNDITLDRRGGFYFTDTRGYHTALNGGETRRVHIVAALPWHPEKTDEDENP